MTRRALLFGSAWNGIDYAQNSVECMASFLRGSLGFDTTCLPPPHANKRAILEALEAITTASQPDDTVVIYYCGHGGTARNDDYDPDDPETLPQVIDWITPEDLGDFTPQTFLGIFGWELSLLLARLSARCPNVTMLADCCSAAVIAGLKPAHPPPGFTAGYLAPFLSPLRHDIARLREAQPYGDSNIVRVVGSDAWSEAFPVPLPDDDELERLGITCSGDSREVAAMTIAVIRLLAPLIDNDEVRPVSWRMLLPALQKQFGTQRPNFVGPVDRIPFSQATRTGSRVAIFTTAPDTYIRLGSPAGVSNGDVYGVVSAGGADLGGDDTILAELTVDDVSATDAHVTVHWLQEDQPELASMAAKLLSTASTRYIVAVAGSAAAETLLRETLEASPLVEVGEAGGEDYLGVVRVADDSFELEDVNHHVIATGKYPIEITALVGHLEDLATTRRLRSLGTGTSPSGSDIEVTLVRYRDGQSQVVANTGELFMTGDRFAVQLRNRLSVNAGATRYVNLVYIDAAGRLRLLNGDVGGISIDPRSSSGDVTRVPDPGDQIWGFPLDWPAGMNTSRPRPVSIAAIVTTDLADLRTLTDPGVIQTRASNDSSRDLTSRRSSHDELDLGMVRYTDAIIWMELELAHDDALANLRSRSSDLARRFRLTASNLDHDRRVDVLLVSRSQRWASATLQLGSAAITWQGDSDDTLEVFAWTSTSNQRISLRDRLVMTGTVEPSSIADESCSPAVSPGRVMADRAIAALGDSATLVFHRAVSSAVLDDLVSLEVEGIQLTVQEIDY